MKTPHAWGAWRAESAGFINLHQYRTVQDALCITGKEYHLHEHERHFDADGTAALGICESLMLALTDSRVLSEKDARNVLTDVASTDQAAVETSDHPEKHHAVIAILERILAGKNGVSPLEKAHQLARGGYSNPCGGISGCSK